MDLFALFFLCLWSVRLPRRGLWRGAKEAARLEFSVVFGPEAPTESVNPVLFIQARGSLSGFM